MILVPRLLFVLSSFGFVKILLQDNSLRGLSFQIIIPTERRRFSQNTIALLAILRLKYLERGVQQLFRRTFLLTQSRNHRDSLI